MAQYGTLITTIGLAKIANAQVTQSKVNLTHIALGDGNGAHYVPTQNQTALVNEVWRGPISNVSVDPNISNRIIADGVIPASAGGFTIREVGLFDEEGDLIAIGQYPETYKPKLAEGIANDLLIHFTIETENASVVNLTVDPTVIIASRKYVDDKFQDLAGVGRTTETVKGISDALNAHLADMVTNTRPGHVRVDNKTIRALDGGIISAETLINVGYFVRDLSLTGEQIIAGLDFQPKIIILFASISTISTSSQVVSFGLDDGLMSFSNSSQSGLWGSDSTNSIVLLINTENYQCARIKSFNPDGFTLEWTKTGNPMGTAHIGYLVFK